MALSGTLIVAGATLLMVGAIKLKKERATR